MSIKDIFQRRKTSIYEQKQEGELTNIIISFLVVASLLVFPFAVFGLIAVGAWLLFFVVAIVRKYSYASIGLIGIVFLSISIYQGVILADHIEEQRLYGNLVQVTPSQQREFVDEIDLEVEVTSWNVKIIDYQFKTTMGPDEGKWESLRIDWDTNKASIHFDPEESGAYFLIMRVFLHDGDRFLTYEYFGRYYVRGSN